MTGEELALARERSRNRTRMVLAICALLASLSAVAVLIHGCHEVQRCPIGYQITRTCGTPANPECIMAMRKNCQ